MSQVFVLCHPLIVHLLITYRFHELLHLKLCCCLGLGLGFVVGLFVFICFQSDTDVYLFMRWCCICLLTWLVECVRERAGSMLPSREISAPKGITE